MERNSSKLRKGIFVTAGLCAFVIGVFSIFSDIAEKKQTNSQAPAAPQALSESTTNKAPEAASAPAMGSASTQAQDSAPELARETVKLISLQKDMIVTAVRQKHSKGGEEDFKKFILSPIDQLGKRWASLPFEVRNRFIYCATALSSHEWHMRDSFKAEAVLEPTSLIAESVEQCEKDSRPEKAS